MLLRRSRCGCIAVHEWAGDGGDDIVLIHTLENVCDVSERSDERESSTELIDRQHPPKRSQLVRHSGIPQNMVMIKAATIKRVRNAERYMTVLGSMHCEVGEDADILAPLGFPETQVLGVGLDAVPRAEITCELKDIGFQKPG